MKKRKKGEKLSPIYEAECPNCGSIFEEEKKRLSIRWEGNNEYVQTMLCPECKTFSLDFKLQESYVPKPARLAGAFDGFKFY